MKKSIKFTFKREARATGLSAVGYPYPSSMIKLNGKRVGTIAAPSWQVKDGLWRIRFTVKKEVTTEEPAPFRWVTLRFKGKDEGECQHFILENAGELAALELYPLES